MKTTELAFGPFVLDRENALLRRDGERVVLAPKPFELLVYLAERGGSLATKDELMAALWPGLHVSESSLTVAMNALRAALGDDPAAPRYIETAPKRGYRFIAEVSSGRALARSAAPLEDVRRRAWVGRADALAVIQQAIPRALGGRRQFVFVNGEAGVGKTTLVEMSLGLLREAGFGVLRCGCNELFGAHEAFLPLTEGLHELCRGEHGPAILATLRERAPTWLAQMPWLLSEKERAAFQREVFGANRERMLREFADLLESATARRPWVLVLEDLHWSDPATIDVLSRLARGDQPCALLAIASYRAGDAATQQHPVHRIHRELQVQGRCLEISLDRLSPDEVERHLALRFRSPRLAAELAERVYARTEGQPLFVVSLVDDMVARGVIVEAQGGWRLATVSAQDELPRDLSEMILRNVGNLSGAERALLDFASASGPSFSALLLAGALERDVLEVEESCERLARGARVLAGVGVAEWPGGEVSGDYAFIHSLYQEAIYRQLSPARRAHIHRRLGASLERGYAARLSEVAPALALHFEVGREFEKAIASLSQAAESSARRFSTREAAGYLSRALELLAFLPAPARSDARLRLLLQRAWTCRAGGDFASALSDLAAMVAQAREAGNLHEEISGLVNLSRFQLYVDRPRCLPLAEEAAARALATDNAVTRALADGNLANLRLMLQPWRDEDAHICRLAENMIDETQDLSARLRKYSLGMTTAILSSDYAACSEATRRGRELAQVVGDVYLYAVYNFTESFAELYAGHWGRTRELATAALAIAERNFNPHASVLCRVTLAWLRVEAQDEAGAAAEIKSLLTPDVTRNPLNDYVCRSIYARACVAAGLVQEARAQLDAMDARIAQGVIIESPVRPHYLLARCEERMAANDWRAARDVAEKLREYSALAPDRQFLAYAHEALARIALLQGDARSAAGHLAEGLRIVRGGGLPLPERKLCVSAALWLATRGRAVAATLLRRRAAKVVDELAKSLEPDDPLLRAPLFAQARSQSGHSAMSVGSTGPLPVA